MSHNADAAAHHIVRRLARRAWQAGVSPFKTHLPNTLRAWTHQHRYALWDSLQHLTTAPQHHGLTTVLIGLALIGPGMLYVTALTMERLGADSAAGTAISVFLNTDLNDADAMRLADRLASQPHIQTIEVMTRAQALAEFRDLSDYAQRLDTLHLNPLPALLLVQPHATLTADQAHRLTDDLRALPEVDQVLADLPWIQRLLAITRLVQRLLGLIGAIMALGIVWVTSHTLRLHIIQHRDAIAGAARLGGDADFIRRPFLYLGVYHGIVGSLIAIIAITLGDNLIAAPARHIASLYGAEFDFVGLDRYGAGGLLLIGVTLTWLSARYAVDRELRRLEPR